MESMLNESAFSISSATVPIWMITAVLSNPLASTPQSYPSSEQKQWAALSCPWSKVRVSCVASRPFWTPASPVLAPSNSFPSSSPRNCPLFLPSLLSTRDTSPGNVQQQHRVVSQCLWEVSTSLPFPLWKENFVLIFRSQLWCLPSVDISEFPASPQISLHPLIL